jgi:hypothetical protein
MISSCFDVGPRGISRHEMPTNPNELKNCLAHYIVACKHKLPAADDDEISSATPVYG